MIRWGEEKRNNDYGHFCRLVASGPGSEKPVWIISDARRRTDVLYFEESYRCRVLKVRVVATEEARQLRGWIFTSGKCTEGDSDVISSYQLFSAILWGKLCEMFVILTSVDVTFSIRLR